VGGMSLPKYPEYKDSGVEWIGQMPSHWKTTRTKHLFDLMKRPVRDEDGVVTAFRDGEVTLRSNRRTDGFTNSLQEIGYQGVRCGDLVVHAMDAFAGAIGVSDSDGKSTPVYSVCRPIAEYSDSRYFARLMRHMALSGFIDSLAKGIRERSTEFRWTEAGNVWLSTPPIDEQAAIAAFLDRETARIDALIAEQEKLITLLAEKRQATISHAVTRGLNPDAPMKDSGVEWLGQVPAHWKVTRLKYATDAVVDCPHETPVYDETGLYRVIRTADISAGILHLEEMYSVAEQEFVTRIRRMSLEKDDIVYGREGERWGFAAQVPKNGVFCLGQRMMQFRATAKTQPRFLMWQMNAQSVYRQGQMDTVGATSPHVNVGTIKNYVLTAPSVEEQREISDFIDEETEKLDALDAEAERAIFLLKERCAALIAAAVTGQIDVRNA
ncbi:MAG: restriction endonuclease subunit S, partial [Ruthenibacterium sp.]